MLQKAGHINKEYSCYDHSDFPAHSMFTSDVCWDNLGTSIFGNSSSVANNARSRLLTDYPSIYYDYDWSKKLIIGILKEQVR